MANAVIDVILTEPFVNKYSKQSPTSKQDDVRDWMSNVWDTYINPNGNYSATFNSVDHTNTWVPASELSDDEYPSTRRLECAQEVGTRSSDAEIVLDHFGEDQENLIDCDDSTIETYGIAVDGNAGTTGDNTAWIDCFFEDNDTCESLPSEVDSTVRTEGIATHELFHTFGVGHGDASVSKIGEATVMYDWGTSPGCTNKASVSYVVEGVSDCTVIKVQDHYDKNI